MGGGAESSQKGGVEILEEALHLLRHSPRELLLPLYLGTLPFTLGLLFFWNAMSAGAGAGLGTAALGLALLFAWKCLGQARFARCLAARLEGQEGPAIDFREALRLTASQTLASAIGWLLLPLAAATILPLPYFLALLHTLPGCGTTGAVAAIREAGRHAGFAPRQNRRLLLILALAGPVAFLNTAAACLLLPELGRRVLGLESIFGLTEIPLESTTFAATVIVGGYYLFIDPWVKAAYALRRFYSRALPTGADLRAELNRLRRFAAAAGLLLAALVLPPAAGGAEEIPAADLERAIAEVLERPEFRWHSPRSEPAVEEPEGALAEIRLWIREKLEQVWSAFWRAIDWLLRKIFPQRDNDGERPPPPLPSDRKMLLALLAAVLLGAGGSLLRRLRRRRARVSTARMTVSAAAPDLTDESVRADELPATGWAALARDLADRGELRLALRALFLGGLAALAERDWVTVHPAASNRDYERELGRRAHHREGMLEAFGESRAVFERVWYGAHPVDREGLERFQALQERIVALAVAP